MTKNFYKLFCNHSGNYLEFDLKPNPKHDANGLGRILLKGQPWGLLPSLPFAEKNLGYQINPEFKPNEYPASVAPQWLDKKGNICRLAAWDENVARYQKVAPGVWEVVYDMGDTVVTYQADITQPGRLVLKMSVAGEAKDPAMIVPVLESDGMNTPLLALHGSGFTAVMQGKTLTCQSNGKTAEISETAVNRTGIYKLVKIPFNGNTLTLDLTIK